MYFASNVKYKVESSLRILRAQVFLESPVLNIQVTPASGTRPASSTTWHFILDVFIPASYILNNTQAISFPTAATVLCLDHDAQESRCVPPSCRHRINIPKKTCVHGWSGLKSPLRFHRMAYSLAAHGLRGKGDPAVLMPRFILLMPSPTRFTSPPSSSPVVSFPTFPSNDSFSPSLTLLTW
jgi:hypothetical protein